MRQKQYQTQQILTLLEEIQKKEFSGTLYLNVEINPERKKRSRVLLWQNGYIIYGGLNVPNNQEFAKMLGQKLKQEWIDTAITFAMQKVTNKTSVRELLEQLVRMRLFTWEQIETLLHTQIVLTLEQLVSHAGKFQFDTTANFDLCHGEVCRGLDCFKLMLDLTRRQEQWSLLVPLIPSMEAVPHLQANALQKITDPSVHKHLQEWVDGQRSLVEIALCLDKDPLHVAQSYLHWVQAGWVVFESSTPAENSDLPTILAVDDSVVMQTLIKQTLAVHYRVLVASNATDALILLEQNKVALLLLDISMPEIDGLELCRTMRSISQFRDLPIIMLTGRDGFIDKIKGQLAGSTQYLTKPFDAQKLRQMVGQYVSVGTASNTGSTSTEFCLSTST